MRDCFRWKNKRNVRAQLWSTNGKIMRNDLSHTSGWSTRISFSFNSRLCEGSELVCSTVDAQWSGREKERRAKKKVEGEMAYGRRVAPTGRLETLGVLRGRDRESVETLSGARVRALGTRRSCSPARQTTPSRGWFSRGSSSSKFTLSAYICKINTINRKKSVLRWGWEEYP